MSYRLTYDDLDGSDENSPSIRAAGNPNPAVLDALLKHYFRHLETVPAGRVDPTLEVWGPNANSMGAEYGTYETPLTAAIRANIPENLQALLVTGADPTGLALRDLSDYAVRFIRGRDPETDMSSFARCPLRADILAVAKSKGINDQIQPLTQAELDERGKGFPRFWTEPNVPGQRLRLSKALTALEVAAGLGNEYLFSMVRNAGADETAWIRSSVASQPHLDMDLELTSEPSFVSTSSPIHEAIAAGQPAMLHALLYKYEYSPNYRPLAAPTIALPPLSFALARCDPSNPDIWACIKVLLEHENLDKHLRSPIFEVHPLHFAVARHEVDLLSRLPMELSSAGTTALGQNLLHIASLPMTSECIDQENPDYTQSIHCARTLDSFWLSHQFPSPMHLDPNSGGFFREKQIMKPTPLTDIEREAQFNTLWRLVREDIEVSAQDVDGNTPLHYLAATLNVDPRSLQLLRDLEGGEETYCSCKNNAGLTPRNLWESGRK